jgi:hypothetical protein
MLALLPQSHAQCSGILNSECTNLANPEYNTYRCSQQRACDSKKSEWRSPSYGAIAYSPATGGFGWDFGVSRELAEQRALKQCREVLRDSGADDDCDAGENWFKAPWCGSIAQAENGGYAIRAAANPVEANRKALEACRGATGTNCKIADQMPQCAR